MLKLHNLTYRVSFDQTVTCDFTAISSIYAYREFLATWRMVMEITVKAIRTLRRQRKQANQRATKAAKACKLFSKDARLLNEIRRAGKEYAKAQFTRPTKQRTTLSPAKTKQYRLEALYVETSEREQHVADIRPPL